MSVIREDEKGLFVIAGGYKARPGSVGGYSHAFRMDDAGLRKGDRVKARHVAGSPLICITLEHAKIYWHTCH